MTIFIFRQQVRLALEVQVCEVFVFMLFVFELGVLMIDFNLTIQALITRNNKESNKFVEFKCPTLLQCFEDGDTNLWMGGESNKP